MQKDILIIKSFLDIGKVPSNKPFTLPYQSHLYYGLGYFEKALLIHEQYAKNFYLNIGDSYEVLFILCKSRIKNIIVNNLPNNNICNMCKDHNLSVFLKNEFKFHEII